MPTLIIKARAFVVKSFIIVHTYFSINDYVIIIVIISIYEILIKSYRVRDKIHQHAPYIKQIKIAIVEALLFKESDYK